MPVKKIAFKSGVNRENTRYTTEGGWYDCDKVRFRQGTPEKIGGWQAITQNTFLGTCSSLWSWGTLGGAVYTGIGTNLKFYVSLGDLYYDITPLRVTNTLTNPFATTNGSATVVVTDAAGGFQTGDYVTFSGASTVGGLDLNNEYEITELTATTYSITAAGNATSTVAAGGGTVTAKYQLSIGFPFNTPLIGWGAGPWGSGTWGFGSVGSEAIRQWSQANFGEDLVFAPKNGSIYYWSPTYGTNVRGVEVSSLAGASDVPTTQIYVLVSDINRFVFAFGTNPIGSGSSDPMLIRWCDQEDITNWTPAATNQAGDLRLSHGSKIITALQARQEVLVWTDSSLYTLQYVGAPIVWQPQLVADSLSILSQSAATYANGVTYWMGVDKFYKYDGRTQTLRCDLRQYIFQDINLEQTELIFSGTNEGFNEVWWFYPSNGSTTIDKYVVYNYLEDVWYYGTMARSAWLDVGIESYPIAATYNNKLVNHEIGVDDFESPTGQPIVAYITSAEFDIDDGDRFSFIWRIIPDITFRGSTSGNPNVIMYLLPLQNSGSGYNTPPSIGGSNSAEIDQLATIPIEQFTGQVYTRVRGRQLSMKVESTDLGVTWQLGSPRIDIRPDGRR